MLDHDAAASLAMINRVFAGQREGLSRDDVLDNITHFWLTHSAVSAARDSIGESDQGRGGRSQPVREVQVDDTNGV
jgi:hypothetical protein